MGIFRQLLRKIETTIDMGLATSFDSHVIAGYRFLMRYYNEGDRIYIFGFSRGSFTARFLARMVSHVGILSRGNDEMVPFAYKVYQEYEQNRNGSEKERQNFMNAFKFHFCRTQLDAAAKKDPKIREETNESGIKVHFLGLFDCVNSVGTLDIPFWGKVPPLPAVTGTANYVRHAVAIDERRVKFKAALFAQEREEPRGENIKEVWFPGNHGDIGGGWSKDKTAGATADVEDDYFQMSDIALKWMIDEVDDVEQIQDENHRFAWEPSRKASFLDRFQRHKKEMKVAKMHDTMTRNGGQPTTSWWKVLFWNWMEWMPFIKRWEFVEDSARKGGWKWDYIMFPLNGGGRRDIPNTALFHHAVINRMRDDPKYLPNNHMWVRNSRDFSQPVKSNDDVTKKNLEDLAQQHKGEYRDRVNGYVKGTPVFVHDKSKTKHSVAIDGWRGEETKEDAKDWNNIYRVEFM